MAVANLWPPATPLLGKLGIVLGPDMLQSVMATVDAGRIKYLSIGMCLELRYLQNLIALSYFKIPHQ